MNSLKIVLLLLVIGSVVGCRSVRKYVTYNEASCVYLYKDTIVFDLIKDSVNNRNYFVLSRTDPDFKPIEPYFREDNPRFIAQYTEYSDNGDFGIMQLWLQGCDYFDDQTAKYFVIINNDTIKPDNGEAPYFSYGFPYSRLPKVKEGSIVLYDSVLGFNEREDSLKNTMGSLVYIDKMKHEYLMCPRTLPMDSIEILQLDPYPIFHFRGERFELPLMSKMSARQFKKSFYVHLLRKNQKMLKQLDEFHHVLQN